MYWVGVRSVVALCPVILSDKGGREGQASGVRLAIDTGAMPDALRQLCRTPLHPRPGKDGADAG